MISRGYGRVSHRGLSQDYQRYRRCSKPIDGCSGLVRAMHGEHGAAGRWRCMSGRGKDARRCAICPQTKTFRSPAVRRMTMGRLWQVALPGVEQAWVSAADVTPPEPATGCRKYPRRPSSSRRMPRTIRGTNPVPGARAEAARLRGDPASACARQRGSASGTRRLRRNRPDAQARCGPMGQATASTRTRLAVRLSDPELLRFVRRAPLLHLFAIRGALSVRGVQQGMDKQTGPVI
jgi:hypothetical protein